MGATRTTAPGELVRRLEEKDIVGAVAARIGDIESEKGELLAVVHCRISPVFQCGEICQPDMAVPGAPHLRRAVPFSEISLQAKAANTARRSGWAGHECHRSITRVRIAIPVCDTGMPLLLTVLRDDHD